MSLLAKPDREISVSSHSHPPSLVTDDAKTTHAACKKSKGPKKIWIDLENSPHIPFFKPIIGELEDRGHCVVLTARDCFQVRELADLFELRYRLIGRHYGKHTLAKVAGLGIRVLQMSPFALREKPDLAVSHGSRSLFVLCSILGIPTVTITDYEHARWKGAGARSWTMAPEVVPSAALHAMGYKDDRILRYPGIKEDVYAPTFRPDQSVRRRLALAERDLVVTIRPPASEAHYHNPESDRLLDAVLKMISQSPNTKVVLLPRTPHQEAEVRKQWPELFQNGRIIVPAQVIDGLDLIWCSDLVISGGGTMNREAAALGVPVYSIFRGKTGAVDEYLAKTGRMLLLQSVEDVKDRLRLVRRTTDAHPNFNQSHTLQTVVDHISRVAENCS